MLVTITLQWTTTTWAGSLFSQESIDLIMLQDRLHQIKSIVTMLKKTIGNIWLKLMII